MSDQMYRVKIALPFIVSWQKNSPRPSLNSPTLGGPPIMPVRRLAQYRLHWRLCGLYKRKVRPSMCPDGPSASNSFKLARPSQTFRTTTVPSYSTHLFDPV